MNEVEQVKTTSESAIATAPVVPLVMPRRPCEGESFVLKDGRTVHIIICHRPGNGWGVSFSELTVKEFYARPFDGPRCDIYMPWHKFKRLVARRAA